MIKPASLFTPSVGNLTLTAPSLRNQAVALAWTIENTSLSNYD